MTQTNSTSTGILNYIYDNKISLGLLTYGLVSGTWFLYKKPIYISNKRNQESTIKALIQPLIAYRNGEQPYILDNSRSKMVEFTIEHKAAFYTKVNEAANTLATINNILYYTPIIAAASILLGIVTYTDMPSYLLGYNSDSE